MSRQSQSTDYHEQYLSTLAELNRIKGEFQIIDLELRHKCGENEGIEDVCSYKRSLKPKLDRESLEKDYPDEFKACFEVGQPTKRFKVLESRSY